MDQTALLVPVPRIRPLLEPWHRRHDPSSADGIPPHVTVLFPFLPPDELDADDVASLRAIMAARPPFEVDLTTVGMFDHDVLHLLPEPDAPFRELTAAVHARFPTAPPYGGRHDEVIPHLTVGRDIPRPSARHAARALLLALPVHVYVDVVQLWVPGPGRWMVGASFPLGTHVPDAASPTVCGA